MKLAPRAQRYSGIMGVVVLWTGIIVAMRRAGLGLVDARPISFLGVFPNTAWLFSASLLTSAVLFIFFAFYIYRVCKLSKRFLIYFLLGQAGQIIAAVVPYGQQSEYRLVHTIAAFTLAFSLPLFIRQFALEMRGKPYHSLYVGLLGLELLTFFVGMGLFIFTKGIAPIGEALPALGFHIWILAITYVMILSNKSPKT